MPDASTRSPVPLPLGGNENDARLPAVLTSTARSEPNHKQLTNTEKT